MLSSYRDLIVWRKCIDLIVTTYQLTGQFPIAEQYGLASQMRRAAISTASNIAEGYARGHRLEYIRFLRIALGSAAELDTQLIICERLCFGTPQARNLCAGLILENSKMLNAMISKLSRKR